MQNINLLHELTKALRYDILQSTTEAGSGHPTSSLSGVELMTPLWFGGFMHVDFNNPKSIANDRIIFSKGHACPLLYALYHRAGVISTEELMSLRKFGSKIEGHPTPEFEQIDVATGSLGQGLSAGLGMALGIKQHIKNDNLNITREPKVFVVLGDSEMAEGQVWEAMELAAHYNVNNLVGIIDVNRLGQRGATMLGWDLETYKNRVESFGWEAIVVEDGHNLEQTYKAFEMAVHATDKPVMIIAKTQKGYGISLLADKDDWHGKPLPKDKLDEAIAELGNVQIELKAEVAKPSADVKNISHQSAKAIEAHYDKNTLVATREAYGEALIKLGEQHSNIVVLDAETSNSTYAEKFKKPFADRFYEMFIAEQNMVSVAIGMSKVGFIPFVSSFSAFFARAFDQIRMAQYSEADIKIVGSHAGISIGADGSSQMGLEDIAMMRTPLESVVLYPSDAVSTLKLAEALVTFHGTSYLRLTREKTPILYENSDTFTIGGSKVVIDAANAQVVLIGAGITLHEGMKAAAQLAQNGIQVTVIDAYSVKPLDTVTIMKHAEKTGKVLVVEDHYPCGGLGEAVKTALSGKAIQIGHIAVKEIPHSGSPQELLQWAGIDAEGIIKEVKKLV